MLIRPLLLISLAFLLLGCAAKVVPLPKAANNTQQARPMPAFNQVLVGGRLNVTLRTGYSRPQVILHGDPRDLAQVVTVVKNNTLQVILNHGYPKFGAVSAELRSRYLNSFSYNGRGRITGRHITSTMLDLNITNPERTVIGGNINLRRLEVNGPGYIEITGVKSQNLQLVMFGKAHVQIVGAVNLSTINLDGDGWFGLYWVKSNQLTIRARGNTFIQLAGVSNKLDLELWDRARFNGRYLRVDSTFVKTHGRSVAEILSLDKQHSLSTDASDIYFYNIPEYRADFMAFNGSTLDMRDWNMPLMEEYDQYNK